MSNGSLQSTVRGGLLRIGEKNRLFTQAFGRHRHIAIKLIATPIAFRFSDEQSYPHLAARPEFQENF
jgi:hypothetical protein